jgi:hypothetical protein
MIKIKCRWTDEFGRTIALGYSSDTTTPGVTNVAWFKALGNGHGHDSTSGTTPESKGSKLAIHDTDVIVTGTYSGHATTQTASAPGLQFPGVHSLYQVRPASLLLLTHFLLSVRTSADALSLLLESHVSQDNILLSDPTIEGLFSTAASGTGGFIAWLVD